MPHMWTILIKHTNESCHTCEGFIYICIYIEKERQRETYARVMPHMWTILIKHMNKSCHTCEGFMSHIWMRHITHIKTLACVYMYVCGYVCVVRECVYVYMCICVYVCMCVCVCVYMYHHPWRDHLLRSNIHNTCEFVQEGLRHPTPLIYDCVIYTHTHTRKRTYTFIFWSMAVSYTHTHTRTHISIYIPKKHIGGVETPLLLAMTVTYTHIHTHT